MREAEPSPEMLATLEAIDATLAGDPVDPEFADVAELALLVRAERPVPNGDFARSLDRRVQERFKSASTKPTAPKRRFRPGWWWWTLAPAGGLAAAIAAVVVLGSGGSGSSAGSSGASLSMAGKQHPTPRSKSSASAAASGLQKAPANTPSLGLRVPHAHGRKLTQSSQLTLGVQPKRIETVAQEIFNVVGEQNGFVDSSNVTAAGTGGYGHFQLSVPSVSLPQTMSALSGLSYATVLQRTDSVEDVTGQYRSAVRHHNKKQIKALKRRIAYSQVAVDLRPEAPPPPTHKRPHHSAFIPRAAHTALNVLTVIAGVALIALAVLVPLALVAALVWWIAATLRRHRREQALDAA